MLTPVILKKRELCYSQLRIKQGNCSNFGKYKWLNLESSQKSSEVQSNLSIACSWQVGESSTFLGVDWHDWFVRTAGSLSSLGQHSSHSVAHRCFFLGYPSKSPMFIQKPGRKWSGNLIIQTKIKWLKEHSMNFGTQVYSFPGSPILLRAWMNTSVWVKFDFCK